MKIDQQQQHLDVLTKNIEQDIYNYVLEQYTDLHLDGTEETQLVTRQLTFSRGNRTYYVVVNPAGQIRAMSVDTPPDLIQQISNTSISIMYNQLITV